jgi:class 3 adenylate cyclase
MDAPKRRLSAVWFADIVAYSTLSSQDETAALKLVSRLQRIAAEVVESYEGRIVKFIGDAVLAEFSSTDSAVRAATSLQERYCAEAASHAGPSAKLRIGVHLGEVASHDGDLYGDGINTAARLQHEAKPGQVLASEDVWRQLRQRPEFRFTSLGPIELRGITTRVGVYDVLFGSQAALVQSDAGSNPSSRGRGVLAGGIAVLVLIAGLAAFLWVRQSGSATSLETKGAPDPAPAILTPATGTPAPGSGRASAGSVETPARRGGNVPAADPSPTPSAGASPSTATGVPSTAATAPAANALGPADLPAVQSLIQRLAAALGSERPMQALAPLGQGALAMGRREIPQMRQLFGREVTVKVGTIEPRGVRGNAGFVRFQLLATGSERPETALSFDAQIVRTPQGLKFADLDRSQPGRRGGPGGKQRGEGAGRQ